MIFKICILPFFYYASFFCFFFLGGAAIYAAVWLALDLFTRAPLKAEPLQ